MLRLRSLTGTKNTEGSSYGRAEKYIEYAQNLSNEFAGVSKFCITVNTVMISECFGQTNRFVNSLSLWPFGIKTRNGINRINFREPVQTVRSNTESIIHLRCHSNVHRGHVLYQKA